MDALNLGVAATNHFRKAWYSRGLRQAVLMIVGNSLATGLAAVALLIISRILGPAQFGEFTVGFAIVLILVRINDFGLSTAVLKYAGGSQDQDIRNFVYTLTLSYKLAFSLVLAVFGFFGAEWLASVLNFDNPWLLRLAFTLGLATTYYEHLLAVLQSLRRFTQAVIINAIQAGAKLLGASLSLAAGAWSGSTNFLFGSLGSVSSTLGSMSSLLGSVNFLFGFYILSPIVPVLWWRVWAPGVAWWQRMSWWQILIGWRKELHDKSLAQWSHTRRKVLSLARHSAVGLVAAGLIENIDILFLQHHLDSYETGIYGGASRIALLFAMVAYSLGNVLNPRVARYRTRDHLQKFIKKAWGLVILAGLGLMVLWPLASPLIWWTIGPEYLAGVGVLQILLAASFLAIASMPFIALFYSFDADWYFSVSGIVQLAIVITGNALLVPIFDLDAAAWTRLASRIFLFGFTVSCGLYLYHKHYVLKQEPALF